ncbi:hypothetical protein TRV_03095 [Trichophyton verrucosum HKI 0517]|uniref:Uncharacterized protein n=1 Tax=Trichophyton verrucosum (strain HKI 0517) TaxID=663202 RepID=D4D7L2_TRIVH|nr:uncharacterized protein TRV_03095 [Trichophyton verrucosum HKI 0517]EFE42180.1 hypothetical protein TRV_03095 [Trichophyton verrucosum HKI 0517]
MWLKIVWFFFFFSVVKSSLFGLRRAISRAYITGEDSDDDSDDDGDDDDRKEDGDEDEESDPRGGIIRGSTSLTSGLLLGGMAALSQRGSSGIDLYGVSTSRPETRPIVPG